jgi:membrane-associated PAP2 superfamily phosphatase
LRPSALIEPAALAAAAILVWLLCERAGLDAWLSSAAFDRARSDFPLRDNWWLAVPGHAGLKYLSDAVWLAAAAVAIAPVGRARAWRREAAHAAVGIALAVALLIGFAAGAVQVARGAHFASHVLWAACIAYGVNLALARLPALRRERAGGPQR